MNIKFLNYLGEDDRKWPMLYLSIAFVVYMVCNQHRARDCINISHIRYILSNEPMVQDRIEGFLLEKQKLSCNKAR
jgi:hypothetical protein